MDYSDYVKDLDSLKAHFGRGGRRSKIRRQAKAHSFTLESTHQTLDSKFSRHDKSKNRVKSLTHKKVRSSKNRKKAKIKGEKSKISKEKSHPYFLKAKIGAIEKKNKINEKEFEKLMDDQIFKDLNDPLYWKYSLSKNEDLLKQPKKQKRQKINKKKNFEKKPKQTQIDKNNINGEQDGQAVLLDENEMSLTNEFVQDIQLPEAFEEEEEDIENEEENKSSEEQEFYKKSEFVNESEFGEPRMDTFDDTF